MQSELETPLARALLAQTVTDGDAVAFVPDPRTGKLRLEVVGDAGPEAGAHEGGQDEAASPPASPSPRVGPRMPARAKELHDKLATAPKMKKA